MKLDLRNFHINLKQLRVHSKKTQREVAQALGITYQSYQAYELGTTFPTLENFVKLCEYFDETPNDILNLND